MIYPNLRHFIDTYITANGNKEITGTILNDLLNSMITALGANYQLAGVATPSTNPGEAEQAVMWFASQAGTYTNFGAIVLPLGIHLLKWDGTSWTSQTFFTVDNAPTEGSNNLISSDAVAQALKDVIDYIELELVDTTGSSSQATQMNVTLRSNQGTEEEPDYITLASIVFGAATNEKAGLLKAAFNKMLAGGFTYAGIATANASSISSPVDGTFYIGGTGTYTGYTGSAIEVALGQVIIVKRSSNAWSYELITIFQVDDAPTSGSAKLVKSGGTFNAIQNSPQLGYFRCNTAAATAAKTVASDNYILPTVGGGCIKIKMTNANTAASGVTLKIGSAEAKPLYYAGQAVSASNTWQDGETVEVYYDGTSYYANNVEGGGGSGDGVYDISAAHSGATYADLTAALGTNGANVPANVKQGGMSVKFVNSETLKYEQWRYMGTSIADADFVAVANWQGIELSLTENSENLVTGKLLWENLYSTNIKTPVTTYTDGQSVLCDSGNVMDMSGASYASVDVRGYNTIRYKNIAFPAAPYNNIGMAFYDDNGNYISGNLYAIEPEAHYKETDIEVPLNAATAKFTNFCSTVEFREELDIRLYYKYNKIDAVELTKGCYDISAANNGDSYPTLESAISNVPPALQVGGLSVRYIDSTTNKYVRYDLISSEWSISEVDWKRIDTIIVSALNKAAKVNVMCSPSTQTYLILPNRYSIFVPIDGNSEYILEGNSNNGTYYVVVKSTNYSDGSIPDYATGEDSVHFLQANSSLRITTPVDARFICVIVENQGADYYPNAFYKVKKFDNGVLYGKKVLCIGDSITWWKFYTDVLQQRTKCILYNRGVSGATVANYDNSLSKSFVERVDLPANDEYFTVSNGNEIGFPSQADYVIILGGVNDWARVRRQQLFTLGDITATNNKSTFIGAWKYLLSAVKSKYPLAKIITLLMYDVYTDASGTSANHSEVTLTDSNDIAGGHSVISETTTGQTTPVSFNDLRNAIKEVSKLYGAECLDLRKSGFSGFSAIDRSNYFLNNDGLHVNNLGSERIAEYIIGRLF